MRSNLGEWALARGGDERSGGGGRRGPARNHRDPGLPSQPAPPPAALPPAALPYPGSAVPSLPARRLHIRYPGGSGAAGEGKVSGARAGRPQRGCRSGSPRHRVKVRPGAGTQEGRQAAVEVGTDKRVSPPSSPTPGPPRYLILDVLLPPLGSDVSGEVLSELHPAVFPSLPLGSSSSRRRRRRQQRLRLLPTWAPALCGVALLSSSAAAEISSEPPSRHLPPPPHSPAPPRPLDVIAMVTAYAAGRRGRGKRRNLGTFLKAPPFLGRTYWRYLP